MSSSNTSSVANPLHPSPPRLHPFVCQTCSKSFTRKDYLTRHELNHNEIKPFKCDQCNLSFTRSDLLSKHFKSKSHQRVRDHLTGGGPAKNPNAQDGHQRFPAPQQRLQQEHQQQQHLRYHQLPQKDGAIIDAFPYDSASASAQGLLSANQPDSGGATSPNSVNYMVHSDEISHASQQASQEHFHGQQVFTNAGQGSLNGLVATSNQRSQKRDHDNQSPEQPPKNFKRLCIDNFLNHHHDEKIHNPPPQPSFILPSTSSLLSALRGAVGAPASNATSNFIDNAQKEKLAASPGSYGDPMLPSSILRHASDFAPKLPEIQHNRAASLTGDFGPGFNSANYFFQQNQSPIAVTSSGSPRAFSTGMIDHTRTSISEYPVSNDFYNKTNAPENRSNISEPSINMSDTSASRPLEQADVNLVQKPESLVSNNNPDIKNISNSPQKNRMTQMETDFPHEDTHSNPNDAEELITHQMFAQTPDMSGGFIDNLFWLFRDASPVETATGHGHSNNYNDHGCNINPASSGGPFMDSTYQKAESTASSTATMVEAQNFFDISPIMYEDVYNELTRSSNANPPLKNNSADPANEDEAKSIKNEHPSCNIIDDLKSYIGNGAPSYQHSFYNNNPNAIKINDATRKKVLHIFPMVKSLENIGLRRFEEYLDLYWFNFAQTFPIIHQATFDPNTVNIYLLISIIIIGMAHSLDKVEYETSVTLNKEYRRIIRAVVDETIEIPLPLIQALLLHNFSSKNFGDMKLNQLAQIDHGANIMYLKFSGLLDTLTEPTVYNSKDSNSKEMTQNWLNWIHYETCKRTIFFEFICDTQHVTFSKLELLSAFDVKLELPCVDEVWNATNPAKFFEEYQKQPRGLYPRPKLNICLGKGYNAEAFSMRKSGNAEKKAEQMPQQKQNQYEPNQYGGVADTRGTSNLNSHKQVSARTFSQSDDSFLKFPKPVASKSTKLRQPNSAANVNYGATPNNPSQQSIKMVSKWPSFLWSLKSMMTAYKDNQKEYAMDCFSLYSRYIILHGLMRICWDMRGQGLLDLGIVSKKKLNEFFKKLERAFLNWKGYFDLHVRLYDEVKVKSDLPSSLLSSLKEGAQAQPRTVRRNSGSGSSQVFRLNNYGRTNAAWANVSFYYTGLFTLYADIPSLTKFATEYKTFRCNTSTLYKDLKEMEHERNKLLIEHWARSLNGKLSLLEACKFLGLVYKHEETINTFSHVPGTAYIAALMIWCYEIKRDCPNVEVLRRARETATDNGEAVEDINLQVDKYFDPYGNVKHEIAREDAVQYFALIFDIDEGEGRKSEDESSEGDDESSEGMSGDTVIGRSGDNDNSAGASGLLQRQKKEEDGKKMYEEFKQRQMKTIGVVCYVLHLLRNCKWSYSVDLVEKLERVVQTYEK